MTNFLKLIYDLISATVTLADFWLLFNQRLLPFIQAFHQQLVVISITMHLIAAATVARVMYRTYWLGVGDEWASIIKMMAAAGALLLATGLRYLSTPASLLDSIIFLFLVLAGTCILRLAAKMQWVKWFA